MQSQSRRGGASRKNAFGFVTDWLLCLHIPYWVRILEQIGSLSSCSLKWQTDAIFYSFYFLSNYSINMFRATTAHHQEFSLLYVKHPVICVAACTRHCLDVNWYLMVCLSELYTQHASSDIRSSSGVFFTVHTATSYLCCCLYVALSCCKLVFSGVSVRIIHSTCFERHPLIIRSFLYCTYSLQLSVLLPVRGTALL
jgi:hypothetical protein